MKSYTIKIRLKSILIVLGLFFGLFNQTLAQYQVGHTTITFQDVSRGNRNIQTEIYYPATVAGNNVPAIQDSFPVIIFGHGFVMAWDAYQNLWDEFVPRGYIMAFPRTEGNAFSTDHQKFGWDLQFLVAQMQLEGANLSSQIYGVVASETALIGHSMGGGAAFLAADSLSVNGNQNLKTLVGLAPAESTTNGVSSINSSKSITIPAVIFSGSQDGVTPPANHHIPMYDSLASNCKTFINVLGGAHCYFANTNFNCDFGESTSSVGISITRTQQHQVTFDFLNLWLDYTLKYDCNAFDVFNDSLANSNRITNNQACVLNPFPVISYNNNQLTSSVVGLSYQWYLNGNPIANTNQITITPTQAGNYEVEVFFSNGCSQLSNPYVYVTTAITTIIKKGINIYPNPATNKIFVTGVDDIEKIQIYNVAGQVIGTYQLQNNIIDISSLPKGLYLLKVGAVFGRVVKH